MSSSNTTTTRQLVPPLLLRPGVAFMRRISMKSKLSLIASVLIVPLLVAVTLLGIRLSDDIAYTRGELAGVEAITLAHGVINKLQDHRSASSQLASGATDMAAAAQQAAQAAQEALRKPKHRPWPVPPTGKTTAPPRSSFCAARPAGPTG